VVGIRSVNARWASSEDRGHQSAIKLGIWLILFLIHVAEKAFDLGQNYLFLKFETLNLGGS